MWTPRVPTIKPLGRATDINLIASNLKDGNSSKVTSVSYYSPKNLKTSDAKIVSTPLEHGTDEFKFLRFPAIDATFSYDLDLDKKYFWIYVNIYLKSNYAKYIFDLASKDPIAWQFEISSDDLQMYGQPDVDPFYQNADTHSYVHVAFRQLIRSYVPKPIISISVTSAINVDNLDPHKDQDTFQITWDVSMVIVGFYMSKMLRGEELHPELEKETIESPDKSLEFEIV